MAKKYTKLKLKIPNWNGIAETISMAILFWKDSFPYFATILRLFGGQLGCLRIASFKGPFPSWRWHVQLLQGKLTLKNLENDGVFNAIRRFALAFWSLGRVGGNLVCWKGCGLCVIFAILLHPSFLDTPCAVPLKNIVLCKKPESKNTAGGQTHNLLDGFCPSTACLVGVSGTSCKAPIGLYAVLCHVSDIPEKGHAF